jgi:DNA-binding response OmpR family regulator
MPTIFVVDSGAMRGNPLLQTVREAGYHTLPMSNADMGLAVLKAIRADLLLVDLSHAETGGARLIEEVRRNDCLKQMPIMAVGARASGEEFRRLQRRVGIGEVLAEGEYSNEGLIEEIRKYLARPGNAYRDLSLEWTN